MREFNRREFLKILGGVGATALGGTVLSGCDLTGSVRATATAEAKTATAEARAEKTAAAYEAKTATAEAKAERATATAEARQAARPAPTEAPRPIFTAVPTRAKGSERLAATPTTVAKTKELVTPAEKSGNKWVLRHPDEDKKVEVVLPDGFTPDRGLHMATDIKPLDIGDDLTPYQDWETALNTKRARGPLAGYNYDYNDFCNNVNPAFTCTRQNDMYSWLVLQGEEVQAPGIGTLKGGPRRSVVLEVLNLDGSVHAWDAENPVFVKHGFTANGRIFDGERNVDTLERNLSGHWLYRQFYGTPEKSYVGITDSPDNALETLLVSVQRKQWGINGDSSKRMEFQLIRAELVKRK